MCFIRPAALSLSNTSLLVGSVCVCEGRRGVGGVVEGMRPDQSPLWPAPLVGDVGGTVTASADA